MSEVYKPSLSASEDTLREKLMQCKWLITDIDGVLTDGKMNLTENGDEFKQFHVRDGIAAAMLKDKGFKLGVLSAGLAKNAINKRFSAQGFDYISVDGTSKIDRFRQFMLDNHTSPDEVIYIGDDINDVEVMKHCGVAICPNDAHFSVFDYCDWRLKTKGGNGCLREIADYIYF